MIRDRNQPDLFHQPFVENLKRWGFKGQAAYIALCSAWGLDPSAGGSQVDFLRSIVQEVYQAQA